MSSWIGLNFQDCRSISMGELNFLHDHIITVILSVILLISALISLLLKRHLYYKFLSEGTLIETIWSLIPALLLLILLLPSIKVLYIVEDVKSPSVTFKIIAHQWYWRYVSPVFKNFRTSKSYEFDSNLERSKRFRLLSCRENIFIPTTVTSRLIITSTDVIHSFSIPSMGLKVDALPGRINQLFCNPWRVGLFFGQCSEICGSNHSFIPVAVNFCTIEYFEKIRKFYSLEDINGTNF